MIDTWRNSGWKYKAAVALCVLLYVVADTAVTIYALAEFGAIERNPLARGLWNTLGPMGLIGFKVLYTATALFILDSLVPEGYSIVPPAGFSLTGAVILIWNLRMILL